MDDRTPPENLDPDTSEPSPLRVSASPLFSGRRDQREAVRQFRETGTAVEPPAAPNLQALLDFCFQGPHDFTLNWSARTRGWTISREAHVVKSDLKWEVESSSATGQPVLLSTRIGIFVATLSRDEDSWRLRLVGTGETWHIQATDLARAQGTAVWLIRQEMRKALETISERK